MKIALIADVHSNVTALDAVLSEISGRGISTMLMAGDVVGYGPDPGQTIEVLSGVGATCIRGNHDRSVCSKDFSFMNVHAEAAARWTVDALGQKEKTWLESLPDRTVVNIDDASIGLHHGSPADPDEYVIDERRAAQILGAAGTDVVVCGHTHMPMVLRKGPRLFVNPGGVGQPRDGDPRASFAILDTVLLEAEVFRVRYDIGAVQRRMRASALPSFLISRLEHGQ